MTKAEGKYLAKVAGLGCVLCWHLDLGETPCEIHHVREGQGMSQRASNWLGIGLCPPHHRGNDGLHGLGERGFERRYGVDEMDLLAMTIERTQSCR